MAKRAATTASPTFPSKIKPTTWGSGETMYRVHDTIYAVDQFNPSPKGNARFSPILDPSGNVIPTLYAATTPRGALMESVFRDVPYRTGFKHIDSKRLEGRVCSTLLFQTDFELLDLSKVALRGLGIPLANSSIQPRHTTLEHVVGPSRCTRPTRRSRVFSGPLGRMTGRSQSCCSAAG